jgi:lysophospholipid acyltransferase (LPLAT)-like uncharacterized protein
VVHGKDANDMKLRDPRMIRLAAALGAGVARAWMTTVRWRIDNRDTARHPPDGTQGYFIYAFWHESLLALTRFRVPAHVLISQHADGELIAQVCRRIGFDVVRGSTTRGGGRALLELREVACHSHLAITPDGPRGPRRQVQPGVVALASCTGLPIVPVGVGFSRAWRAGSWDRFAIPKPFSTTVLVGAPSVRVPNELDRHEAESYRQLVEQRLLAATEDAQRLATGAGASNIGQPHPTSSRDGDVPRTDPRRSIPPRDRRVAAPDRTNLT